MLYYSGNSFFFFSVTPTPQLEWVAGPREGVGPLLQNNGVLIDRGGPKTPGETRGTGKE